MHTCMKYKLVNTGQIFVDATHVKACANSKKMRKRVAHEQALWYEEELNKEIEKDRLAHGKKPLKKKDDNQPPASGGTGNDKDSISEELPEDVKTQKCSISDPESGWFRKGEHCAECQYPSKCTESKDHVKMITRHVWEEYMEVAEDIRHTIGNRQIYQLRKETIERIFGTAKEQHGFRYTQYVGKARMEMKAGLTFACMNLKKLAKILEKRGWNTATFLYFELRTRIKSKFKEKWCWA